MCGTSLNRNGSTYVCFCLARCLVTDLVPKQCHNSFHTCDKSFHKCERRCVVFDMSLNRKPTTYVRGLLVRGLVTDLVPQRFTTPSTHVAHLFHKCERTCVGVGTAPKGRPTTDARFCLDKVSSYRSRYTSIPKSRHTCGDSAHTCDRLLSCVERH